MSLVLANKIPNNRFVFLAKTELIAAKLGISPNWLMCVMYVESKLNPQAKNKGSSAVGLIQFTAATAKELGTTTTALAALDNVTQLDYVYKYLARYTAKINSLYDCYFAVFYPAAMGKTDSAVLFKKGQRAYTANSPLDTDKDGAITVADVKAWFNAQLPPDARIETAGIGKPIFYGLAAAFLYKYLTN